jgi:DNA-binding NarL/FixJ family response regulator
MSDHFVATTTHSIIEQVQMLQHTGQHQQASRLLAQHAEELLAAGHLQQVEVFLQAFPVQQHEEDAYLRYVAGLIHARNERPQDALRVLERARFSFVHTERNYVFALLCSLEMARVRQSHDDFRTAFYHLYDEAAPMVDGGLVQEPGMRGRYYLRLAELAPDIGKLRTSSDYASQALATFRTIGDASGQFHALVRLATTASEIGDYAEAESKLQLAESSLEAGKLGRHAQARLLNLRVHIAWFRGDLIRAVELAHEFRHMVDAEQFRIYGLYARILLGNLLRGLSRFADARHWYLETQTMIQRLAHHRYQPWLDVQTGWLHLLEGRIDSARAHVQSSLHTSDLGQAMSFKVHLAVINILDGAPDIAQTQLQESYVFYAGSGDELSMCAIGFYLALIALRRQQMETARSLLEQSLGWMEQRRIDYFPFWWHPSLLAELCVYALISDCCADTAERILLRRLSAESVPFLRRLVFASDEQRRQRSLRMLRLLGVSPTAALDEVANAQVRAVLEDLLLSGLLRWEGFDRLWAELRTANQRHAANPMLLAVFGLYVSGREREEIRSQLGCSEATVRNYVTAIYDHFGLTEFHGSRRERRLRLVALAQGQGLIG